MLQRGEGGVEKQRNALKMDYTSCESSQQKHLAEHNKCLYVCVCAETKVRNGCVRRNIYAQNNVRIFHFLLYLGVCVNVCVSRCVFFVLASEAA